MSFIPVVAIEANYLIKRCLATIDKLPAWPRNHYRDCLELAAEHLEFGNTEAAVHVLGNACDSIVNFSEAGIEAMACKEAFDSITEMMDDCCETGPDEDDEDDEGSAA